MTNLEEYQLKELFSEFNLDYEKYSVEFKYLEPVVDPHIETNSTMSCPLNCVIQIKNKMSGEVITLPKHLMELPLKGTMGLKIDGTNYEFCAINERASGWYHVKVVNNSTKEKVPSIELLPERGRSFHIIYKNNLFYVVFKSKKSGSKQINLAIFLKALTGMTYRELLNQIGVRNRIISRTFVNELSYSECVDIVLDALIASTGNSKGHEHIPPKYRSRELAKMLGPTYIRMNQLSRDRYNRDTSFLFRALDLDLAEPVLNYPVGTKLTAPILKEIDESDIDTLCVIKSKVMYELKKYKVTETDLCPKEFFTEINMLCNNIIGFNLFDSIYDDVNRTILPLRDSVRKEVTERLISIVDYISAFLLSESVDLVSLDLDQVEMDKPGSFIDKCKQEFKNTQGAETTNIISHMSKDYKVVLNYSSKTNAEMLSIKGSQQSVYDHYHIPESEKVGLVNHLTLSSYIGSDGMVYSPYLEVKNGEIESKEPVWLNPRQREGKYIAPWDEDLSKARVRCYYKDDILDVDRTLVNYKEHNVLQTMSLPTALNPFMQFSEGKRITMGCNGTKQAFSCLKSEAPLVSTGTIAIIHPQENAIIRATDLLNKIYDHNNLIDKDVDYDEFMKGSIKLDSIDNPTLGYRSYMFVSEFNGSFYSYMIDLPFSRQGTSDSMFHYFLKYTPGHVYSGKEIVLYNSGIDIKKYDLDLNVNLGALEVEDDVFDFDTALGCNFLAAFKSSGIPNMDDAIVISDELLGTGKLAHVKLVQFKHEIKRFREGVKERFGVIKESSVFGKNGLPKVGTWLKPKSNAIGIIKTKKGIEYQEFESLGADLEGEVIAAEIKEGVARVYIATIAEIELGDKLAGDHGNKGVIGRIVPKKDMPYMEDGTPLQMTLNPLGVPSRMNFSQILVALLSFSAKMQNKRFIISSANPDSYEIVQREMEAYDLGPVQLYDGRTGLPFDRLTTTGFMYMKKLCHTVKSKMNNCGVASNYSPITGQPMKGKNVSGGQTIGEMETWAFEASGLHNTINELFTIKSDDAQHREDFLKCIENGLPYTGKLTNSNIEFLQAELRMLGCDIVLRDGEYSIRPLTDRDIRGLSLAPLKNIRDALQDDDVFGECITPRQIQEGKSRYSYLDLGCEIVHPIWIYKYNLPSLISFNEVTLDDEGELKYSAKFFGKDKVRDLINGKYFVEILGTDMSNYSIRGSKDSSLLSNPIEGMKAFVQCLKVTDLRKVKLVYQKMINKFKDDESWQEKPLKRDSIFTNLNKISTIDTILEQGLEAKDFIITSYPVLPKPLRFGIDGQGSSFDKFYSRIMSTIQDPTLVDSTKVYQRILEFVGLDESVKVSKDTNMKNGLEYFTGKGTDNKSKGASRINALSHIAAFSGRSVIIPGNVKLGYVGLPRQACYNVLRVELPHAFKSRLDVLNDELLDLSPLISGLELKDLSKCIEFLTKNCAVDKSKAIEIADKCDDIVRDLLNHRPVVIGRQPTLHEESIQGLIPIMVEDNALHLHPLLCSGFNADFDGDQMWYVFAHQPASIQEILGKAHPKNKLYSNKDGSVSLTPTQDILLGLYLATMLHDNVLDVNDSEHYRLENIRHYRSLDSMKSDIEVGFLNRKDLVTLTIDGRRYLSTAGRIILNSLTPSGLTSEPFTNPLNIPNVKKENYCDLKFDGLIRKAHSTLEYKRGNEVLEYTCYSISEFIADNSKNLAPEEILTLLDEIVAFGIESCVVSGITLHLDDFKDDKLSEIYAKRYDKFLEKRNELYELGLLTDESRKQIALKATNFISKSVKDGIMDHYSRNDNLFIIMDSGARGNVAQVTRSTGLIGTISKSNTEQIETPILNGFKRGLKSSDVFIMANGTRHGISTVQKDTGKVGEMTRALVFGLDGLKVIKNDCGCGLRDFKVLYDECKTDTVPILDKKLDVSSDLFKETLNITKDGIITTPVINYILKHHIADVPLSDGTVFKLKYKLSKLFKSMYLNKLSENLPGLENGRIITNETLDYIEAQQLKTIKTRTVITCHAKNGICAKCYGILHNGRKFPPVGYAAGIIAGQSIGEPATQINLDTINVAGAGNAAADAVALFKGMAAGNIPKAFTKSILAPREGFVSIQDSGEYSIIDLFGTKHKVLKGLVKVIDGEKVFPGQELTKGIYDVNQIPEIDDYLRERLLKLTQIYFDIFKNSGVDIDARHFEVLVRAQQSYSFVLESNDPEIPEGSIQLTQTIQESIAKGYEIVSYNRTLKKTEQIIEVSGPLSAICHHDPARALAMIATNKTFKNNRQALVGNLISGTDLVTNSKGIPNLPNYRDFVNSETIAVEEENLEELVTSEVFSFTDSQIIGEIGISEDIDIDDFDEDDDDLADLVGDDSEDDFAGFGKVGSSNVFGGRPSVSNDLDDLVAVSADQSHPNVESSDSDDLDDLFSTEDTSSPKVDKIAVSSIFGNVGEEDDILEDLCESIEEEVEDSSEEDLSMYDEIGGLFEDTDSSVVEDFDIELD